MKRVTFNEDATLVTMATGLPPRPIGAGVSMDVTDEQAETIRRIYEQRVTISEIETEATPKPGKKGKGD